jgi:hypothetical protein
VAIGLVCGGCLGAGAVALGAEADSTVGYTPNVNGHVYSDQSIMLTQMAGSPSDWAYTVVSPTSGTVPTGWMAADARKYKNDAVCEDTGYQYSNYATNTWSAWANTKACGSGTYYSAGIIGVWAGNEYLLYDTFLSPSLNG